MELTHRLRLANAAPRIQKLIDFHSIKDESGIELIKSLGERIKLMRTLVWLRPDLETLELVETLSRSVVELHRSHDVSRFAAQLDAELKKAGCVTWLATKRHASNLLSGGIR